MRKILTKIKSNKIVLILFVSLILNIIGIFYAYPLMRLVGDEPAIMGATLKMINEFSLRPAFDDYYYLAPAVYIYLPFYLIYFALFFIFGIVHSVAELRTLVLLDYASLKMLVPIARLISILISFLSVYLVYKTSRVLFKDNKVVALWSSFFTATSLIFVQLSHFGRIWIIQVLAVILGFYYLSLVLKEKKDSLNNYLISGFLIALSFGIHLVGIVLYPCFLFAHYSLNKGKGFVNIFIKNTKFWLANLAALLSVVFIYLLHPNSFRHYFGLLRHYIFIGQDNFNNFVSSSGKLSLADVSQTPSFINSLKYFIPILFDWEPFLIILFLISLPILFLKQRKTFYFLSLFIVFYYLTIGPILKTTSPRYIVPLIPFLAIVAGYGLVYLTQFLKFKLIKRALLFLIIPLFLYTPFCWSITLLKPNTFVLTKQWIEDNLPQGEKIINFGLDYRLTLNENKQTVVDISKYTPELMGARRRYLLNAAEEVYPQPNYYILYRPSRRSQEFLDKNQFNYLIIHWWDNERRQKLKEEIALLDYQLELVQSFYPNESMADLTDLVNNMERPLWLLNNIQYTGPYVEIYMISKL